MSRWDRYIARVKARIEDLRSDLAEAEHFERSDAAVGWPHEDEIRYRNAEATRLRAFIEDDEALLANLVIESSCSDRLTDQFGTDDPNQLKELFKNAAKALGPGPIAGPITVQHTEEQKLASVRDALERTVSQASERPLKDAAFSFLMIADDIEFADQTLRDLLTRSHPGATEADANDAIESAERLFDYLKREYDSLRPLKGRMVSRDIIAAARETFPGFDTEFYEAAEFAMFKGDF